MGVYTCQLGVVHKMCPCRTPHTIVCDKPDEHGFNHPVAPCLVLEMWLDAPITKPKHLAEHLPHDWWYTSFGGGHQLNDEPKPGDSDYGRTKKWHCPGGRL